LLAARSAKMAARSAACARSPATLTACSAERPALGFAATGAAPAAINIVSVATAKLLSSCIFTPTVGEA
jgi:hypothetical protein